MVSGDSALLDRSSAGVLFVREVALGEDVPCSVLSNVCISIRSEIFATAGIVRMESLAHVQLCAHSLRSGTTHALSGY